ncbi:hypothetical protein Halha_0679 [Halobacteroides halobius DSM 5150]|uniref:Uncharacterized protein n=1 Tax=Halobacteroides halobius (strain ATCC 35273 / DSM 5150 / MD-1) TaxID=748449 RepID=L0K5U4_HALHC|nr:hypothetical protein [Halobacteroides halobius]AGB40652.1 hypothetical protein Halha_0679 [Halobacteroides halobius DSM 5150]
MKLLAKKLALLFFVIAISVISLVGIGSSLNWITILKRDLIGGLLFSLLGGVIGQLVAYNLDNFGIDENSKPREEVAASQADTADKNEQKSKMESLEFDTVDQTEENVVNMAQEDPAKMADLVSNMSDQD